MIKINGEFFDYTQIPLQQFLEEHGYQTVRIAVERNEEIVPKKKLRYLYSAGWRCRGNRQLCRWWLMLLPAVHFATGSVYIEVCLPGIVRTDIVQMHAFPFTHIENNYRGANT